MNDDDTRDKRFIGKAKKKLGFFGSIAQMGRLAYDQYSDTKTTFRTIFDILNDSFSDTATKAVRNLLNLWDIFKFVLFFSQKPPRKPQ